MVLINTLEPMASSTLLSYGSKQPLQQTFSRQSLQTLSFRLWFQSTLTRYINEERIPNLQHLLKWNIKKLGLNDILR